jgi:hypothetical protein
MQYKINIFFKVLDPSTFLSSLGKMIILSVVYQASIISGHAGLSTFFKSASTSLFTAGIFIKI